MYDIRPCSVKEFLDNNSIIPPRFQRKFTWDDKKNFKLCISIFNDYPLGVCIISTEKINGRPISYLLDGRQRKNVFNQMYENPDVICRWAQKFLGFKNSTELNDLKDKFDEKVKEYLESDEELGITNNAPQEDNNDADETVPENITDNDASVPQGHTGLDLLYHIISTFYKRSKHYTGFSSPFDFIRYLDNVEYVDCDSDNTYVLNGKKLKSFLDGFVTYCKNNSLEYRNDSNIFAKYITQRAKFKTGSRMSEAQAETKLKELIKDRWQQILTRIDIIEDIKQTLSNSKIGIIEVSGVKPHDSQKIFNIINSEGVKLTAAEVSSASSYWNRKINNPSEALVSATKSLYSNMDIPNVQGVVHWDVPATFLERIGTNFIFPKLSWDSKNKKSEFEKKLTIGFKVFAGVYKYGITKDDIDELGKDNNINWGIASEELISDFKTMIRLISNIPYFEFLNSWKTTIMDLTSDAIAINFLLVMYFDWKRKGKPYGNSAKASQFQKNCIVLWDKLIYEYIKTLWRGSSDSKVARNIETIRKADYPDVFVPVSENDWSTILKSIKETRTIDENSITISLMKPILFHTYCLKKMRGPQTDYPYEVDHIIPQKTFKSASGISQQDKTTIQDSLYNLGLLPKKENISKGDSLLKEVDDEWLISQIENLEQVSRADFEKFSNINNRDELFTLRKENFFDKAFGEERNNLLAN